jgi:hypothetical protein
VNKPNLELLIHEIIETFGVVGPPQPAPDLFRRIQNYPKAELLAETTARKLRKHKVHNLAYSNICRLPKIDAFGKRLLEKIEAITPAPKSAPPTLGEIQALLGVENALFIKGAALAALYPQVTDRFQLDVDVIVPNFESLWQIFRTFPASDSAHRLKIYLYPRGEIAGSIDLSPSPLSAGYPKIDVHVGSFHLWGAATYRPNLWTKKIKIDSVYLPSWEDTLLLVAGHVTTDWLYRLRDINDLYVLLAQRGQQMDWDYILEVAKQEKLLDILQMLLSETRRIYPGKFKLPLTISPPSGWVESLFLRRSWGTRDRLAGLLLQYKFIQQRYRQDEGLLYSLKHSLRNSFNLLIYNYRAYAAPRRRLIRRIKSNEVLILVPVEKLEKNWADLKIGRPIGSSTLQVVNEGTTREYFVTPTGIWAQSSYSGVLEEPHRKKLAAILADTLGVHAPDIS